MKKQARAEKLAQRRAQVLKHWDTLSNAELAKMLGIGYTTLDNDRIALGLRRTKEYRAAAMSPKMSLATVWGKPLLEILALMYPVMATDDVCELLGMSHYAVTRQAVRSGLKKTPETRAAVMEAAKAKRKANSYSPKPEQRLQVMVTPSRMPAPMTAAQLAQRAKERITLQDYRTLPHRNGTMHALYQGAELAYRGRSTPCNH